MRQTGITTRQIKNAPGHAIYVWCNSEIHYPRSLADDLGRKDLSIVRKSWVLNHDNYRGRRLRIVFDHDYQPVTRIECEAHDRLICHINHLTPTK